MTDWFPLAKDITQAPSHFSSGRRVTPWKLEPMRVFGGFKLAWKRWVLVLGKPVEGWDEDFRPIEDRSVYKTEEEALEAVKGWERVLSPPGD